MRNSPINMAMLASFIKLSSAAISSVVTGTPMGFADGVTGGGDANPVYPTTIDELKTYLTSSDPQVIVISGTFDFSGSEGTQTEQACNQYDCTPENGGQGMLNTLNGCTDSTYSATLDTAAYQGINVASDKTLVGTDDATLYGKGLRFVGVDNIIIQNVHITELNPKYVWGGDAITLADSTNIWIDHVHTSNLGRQHYAFGQNPNSGITVSNSFIDGATSYSSTCDGSTYWGLEMVGTDDYITFYKNWVYKTSGRSPALSGGTFLHAVNNVWSGNTGHLIEGDQTTARGIYEGNYFINDPVIVSDGFAGGLFSSDAANVAECASVLGRNCVPNAVGSGSGTFSGYADTSFFSDIAGMGIVGAQGASSIAKSVVASAGNTL